MLARRILRLLGTRYGIIAIIVVVVVIVVGAARLNPEPTDDTARHNTEDESLDEDEGHEHVDGFDESQEDLDEDLTKLPPEAVDTALAFAKAWVNPDDAEKDAWFEAISKYTTKNLQKSLKATDPKVVPADKIVGKPDAKANNVKMETDAGLLTLRVIKEDGSWKVDGIDFENP